jgi:hypothetical protein
MAGFEKKCNPRGSAEAEACLRGIKLAVEWIRQPIVIESDCLTLIRAIETRSPGLAGMASFRRLEA